MQQHHRQQAVYLGLVGHQLDKRAPESQRLARQLAAGGRRRIPLVEDQVDDREHGVEPIGQQMIGRHSKRDPGGLDLALCPYQPLRHRRLADQERSGDLASAHAAERTQRESYLGVGGQCRMTAGEHELESLVWKCRRVAHRVLRCFVVGCLSYLQQMRLHGERAIAANAVDRSAPGRRQQPDAGVGGDSVARPALRGDREGLLCGLLSKIEVAEEADQRSEDASPLLAEGSL